MNTYSPLRHIRESVFGANQKDFAEIIGTTQATVSRIESGKLGLTDARKKRVKREAERRGRDLDFSLFFEPPAS